MTLKNILDDWAEKLCAKAAQNDTTIQESTDAFKAVTSFYAATQKRGKKSADDEDPSEPGGFSFEHGNEVVNGDRQHPQVRTRRNS